MVEHNQPAAAVGPGVQTDAPDQRLGALRSSLAARVSALVLLVLLATSVWGFVTLRQLRGMQAGFDRLVQVYAVFDKRLAEAHVQAVRIGEQVRTHHTSQSGSPPDGGFIANFVVALQARRDLVERAREPIIAALREPERFGGDEELAELRRILASLDHLRDLTSAGDAAAARRVLDDIRGQGQIEQLFETMRAQSGRAIEELRDEVQAAQLRTERWTIGLALLTLIVGVFATVGIIVTLRPLRLLAQGVRRLGGGDWSQRVPIDMPGRRDEVTRLAEEFNEMAEALQERERRLLRGERLAAAGQLAAQISHEIRNPLSSVALNVELLEDELGDSREGRRLLEQITKEVDRLTNITESYLRFARRPKPELVELDLAEELRGLLAFLGPELQLDGVTVTCDLPAGGAVVRGDANQLRQVFLNLLRNAKEAVLDEDLGGRGRAPHIDVTLQCKGDRVLAVVRDNGAGIPLEPDKLDRIFEAFYTRKARGTGLGLPMVQQILADHLGTVRVGQTGPEGTSFEVELPACAPRPGALSSEPAGDETSTPRPETAI